MHPNNHIIMLLCLFSCVVPIAIQEFFQTLHEPEVGYQSITISTSSACVYLWASLDPIWHKFFSVRAEMWQSYRRQISKHNGKTSWSINLVFQVLSDDRHPDRASLCRCIIPPLNKQHNLQTFLFFMAPFPYNSTSWQWILAGKIFLHAKIKSQNAPHNRRD
jgi:hypothetical protein